MVIVRLTEAGLFAVGVAVAEGVKLQVAPAGNPALQLNVTFPLKIPAALRMTEVAVEIAVELGFVNTVAEEGAGAAMPKSTTSKFKFEKE
jgi:hypothetical protein